MLAESTTGMAARKIASTNTHNSKSNGTSSSREEREKFLKPYLPASPTSHALHSNHPRHERTKPFSSRSFPDIVALVLHKLLFQLIQFVFTIYIRIRQTYHALNDRIFTILYYHHRTPDLIQKDVKGLGRLPKHLSVIVDLKAEGSKEATRWLMSDVAELSAWCVCAGIPTLSVYERTGEYFEHFRTRIYHHRALLTRNSRRIEVTHPRAASHDPHDLLNLLPTPTKTLTTDPRSQPELILALSISIPISFSKPKSLRRWSGLF